MKSNKSLKIIYCILGMVFCIERRYYMLSNEDQIMQGQCGWKKLDLSKIGMESYALKEKIKSP